MIQKIVGRIALLAAVTVPAVATAADDVGPAGHITELEVHHTGADSFLAFHGRVFIGDKKDEAEYRWGGTSCGSKVLSDTQVTLLMRAFDSGFRVVPRYKAGQGSTLCLVGFSIVQ